LGEEINKYSKKISEKLLEEFLKNSIDLGKMIRIKEKNGVCEDRNIVNFS
jgi:hypothetical protein